LSETYYQLPLLTPASDWKAPTELPDLRGRPLVAIDTEEKDDGLSRGRGPGWAYKAGHVIGVSYATADGVAGYLPIQHPDTECFDRDAVGRWLGDLVKSRTPLLFQNAPYDLGWMHADLGVTVPAEYPIEDALAAAFMIDENEYEYNLEAICKRLGMPGKDETLLREAAAAYLRPAAAPRSWKLTQKELKSNMWRMPGRYVGPYATTDAVRTLEAFTRLRPSLAEQGLTDAYRLEMDLVPTIRAMRSRGIKINEDKAEQHRTDFRAKRDVALAEITRRLPPGRGSVGMEQLRTNKWLEPTFGEEGIRDIGRTEPSRQHPDGMASFKQDWMEKHPHWLPKLVARALQCDAMAERFIGTFILDFTHRGRIHAEIHQYKSDDGGTVSYRFSYSNPPLQQAPSPDMDAEFGLPFREVFEADGIWGANDYSQQEYRLTAHFAALLKVRGGEEAARKFHEDPKLDFHQMVADLTGLPRSKAKIQNFALLYGQGLAATAAKLGLTEEEAKELRELVSNKAPFGPALDEFLKQRAQKRGYLKLLDGARVRFDEWEAGWVSRERYLQGQAEKRPMAPCSLEEARARRADPNHPWSGSNLRRAGVRKALNRLIQGSAARQTKLAMRECARERLIPVLQMHDELDHDEDSEAKILRVAEIMRNVVPLRVPMKVDTGTGVSWAAAKAKG
jgi:DNA polymerase I-like protein with 3'-5' exonuclease and polymerase domains